MACVSNSVLARPTSDGAGLRSASLAINDLPDQLPCIVDHVVVKRAKGFHKSLHERKGFSSCARRVELDHQIMTPHAVRPIRCRSDRLSFGSLCCMETVRALGWRDPGIDRGERSNFV